MRRKMEKGNKVGKKEQGWSKKVRREHILT